MFGNTLYGNTFKDVNFVPLQSATFCVQCEMISANHQPYCLACGQSRPDRPFSRPWRIACATSRLRILSPI